MSVLSSLIALHPFVAQIWQDIGHSEYEEVIQKTPHYLLPDLTLS